MRLSIQNQKLYYVTFYCLLSIFLGRILLNLIWLDSHNNYALCIRKLFLEIQEVWHQLTHEAIININLSLHGWCSYDKILTRNAMLQVNDAGRICRCKSKTSYD